MVGLILVGLYGVLSFGRIDAAPSRIWRYGSGKHGFFLTGGRCLQVQLRLALPCNPNISVKVFKTGACRNFSLLCIPCTASLFGPRRQACWADLIFVDVTYVGGCSVLSRTLPDLSVPRRQQQALGWALTMGCGAGRLQIAGCKDEGTCNKIVRHVINCLNSIYEGSRDGSVQPPTLSLSR